MKRQKQHILENLIYLIIWLVVFIVPIFGIQEENKIDWVQVVVYWKRTIPFLVLFLVNNYLLIPYFLLRKRSWIYLLLASLCFSFIYCSPYHNAEGNASYYASAYAYAPAYEYAG